MGNRKRERERDKYAASLLLPTNRDRDFIVNGWDGIFPLFVFIINL